MDSARQPTSPPRPATAGDAAGLREGGLTNDVGRLKQYLLATRELVGYGVFTWDIPRDRLSEDSTIDDILGVPFMRDHSGDALRRMLELVHPDDRSAFKERLAASLRPGGEFRSEHRLILPRPGSEPEERWASVIGRVEFDDGAASHMVGVFGDVTDRRAAADAQLRQDKLEALTTLTSGVAHDFNNVLGAILNFVQLARHEIKAGVSPDESLDEIERGATRAADTVSRLLSFSRDDPPRREPFDFAAVVDEACALMAPVMGEHVALHKAYAPGVPHVDGDPTQLHQVVVNLLSNARQAIADGAGEIRVSVDAADGGLPSTSPHGVHLCVRVADSGPGIEDAIIGRIFDPFFTTREVGQGTGLGLSSTQGIVQRHGGTITAANRIGGGAEFTVRLPATAAPGSRAPVPAAQETGPPAGGEEQPRIVFVDDEPALATLAERALPHSGCAVRSFTSPLEALAAIQADPGGVDVLITDFAMPGMSGIELIVAAREACPALPAVLTSGHLDGEDRADAARCRVDAIVPKPCTMDDLAAAALASWRR